MDWDDFEMEMIDGGAEEIESDDDEVMITTAFEDFGHLSHKLDELGIEVKSAELQRVANNTKEVSEEQFKDLKNKYENLSGKIKNFITYLNKKDFKGNKFQ